ncbi:MAG: hypothetical protein A2V66_16395 [Ignavibacteria bacterium RBG_13_36_8]|nr:MAG: hypothetical protein A2V66_16395 [Ignavibacteria bacterium RBG_13_36_8]
MDNITIRDLLYSEVELIRYLQPKGWSDITFYFRMYTRCAFCYPIAAVQNSRIIGVATGIKNKDTGWVAHVIVSPNHYRHGIGQMLTEHVVKNLDSLGCKTQLLIATQMGEKLYEKLGFRTSGTYKFFKPKQIQVKKVSKNIRQLKYDERDEILALDEKISGEFRKHMLEMFLKNGWIYIDPDTNKIKGYFLQELGEGSIIATDEQGGTELLEFKHHLGPMKTTIPDKNKTAEKFLLNNGFEEYQTAPRMVLGKEVDWKPECVYSRIGGHYA